MVEFCLLGEFVTVGLLFCFFSSSFFLFFYSTFSPRVSYGDVTPG